MTTGYLGTATTPDPRVSDIERRLALLEMKLDRYEHAAEMRRMWLWYYRHLAMIAVMIAVIVYLAASLE